MSKWESLRSVLTRRNPDEDSREMLQMELSNLKFRIDESKLASDVKETVNDLFREPQTWDNAYEIEKKIAMLLTGDLLHQEITARLRL